MAVVYKPLGPCYLVSAALPTVTIAQKRILYLLGIALTPCLKSQVKQEALFHRTPGKCLAHLLLRSRKIMVKISCFILKVGRFAPRTMG